MVFSPRSSAMPADGEFCEVCSLQEGEGSIAETIERSVDLLLGGGVMSSIFGRDNSKKQVDSAAEIAVVEDIVQVYQKHREADLNHHRALQETSLHFFPHMSPGQAHDALEDNNHCLKTFAIQLIRAKLYSGGALPGGLSAEPKREAEIRNLDKIVAVHCQCSTISCRLARGETAKSSGAGEA